MTPTWLPAATRLADGTPGLHATAHVGALGPDGRYPVTKTYTSGTRTLTLVPPDLLFKATVGFAVHFTTH